MSDFLNLPHLKTLDVDDCGDMYRIKAEILSEPRSCAYCISTRLYKHGSQPQDYLDTPMHGRKVLLSIDRKRYRCRECEKTFFERFDAADGKRQATQRLVEYVERRCLTETFLALAREVGLDDKTVRNIFDDYVARRAKEVNIQTPEVLGIDELKIIGDYRAMLTNIGQLSLYDLLPSRKKVSLLDYFSALPDKQKVQVLVMDMWRPYRDVGRSLFPGRMIVVDKFHVVRMANDALEMVRKKVRKKLDRQPRLRLKDDRFILLRRAENLSEYQHGKAQEWFRQFPVLKYAYDAKERYFDIYQQPTRSAAESAAEKWVHSLDPSIAKEFSQVRTALGNWWTEIFNYFECPVTNAYTESVNGLAKNIQRMGRGYSFEVIRARLLYEERALKGARTSVRRHAPRRDSGGMRIGLAHPGQFGRSQGTIETTNYGAHLPTLAKLLEDGYFKGVSH